MSHCAELQLDVGIGNIGVERINAIASAEISAASNALLDRFPAQRRDDRVAEPMRITGGPQALGGNHLRLRFD